MSRKTTNRPTPSRKATSAAGARRRPPAQSRSSSAKPKTNRRGQTAARRSVQAARCLWAVLTGLVIAALLFEPTMVWTLGVGLFMLANAELTGLWLLVVGYGMACLPAGHLRTAGSHQTVLVQPHPRAVDRRGLLRGRGAVPRTHSDAAQPLARHRLRNRGPYL